MLKLIHSIVFATFITIILVIGMTIGSEVSSLFKSILAKGFGHHWVAKSIISLATFMIATIFYYIFCKEPLPATLKRLIIITLIAIVAGGIIIFGYYLYHVST